MLLVVLCASQTEVRRGARIVAGAGAMAFPVAAASREALLRGAVLPFPPPRASVVPADPCAETFPVASQDRVAWRALAKLAVTTAHRPNHGGKR